MTPGRTWFRLAVVDGSNLSDVEAHGLHPVLFRPRMVEAGLPLPQNRGHATSRSCLAKVGGYCLGSWLLCGPAAWSCLSCVRGGGRRSLAGKAVLTRFKKQLPVSMPPTCTDGAHHFGWVLVHCFSCWEAKLLGGQVLSRAQSASPQCCFSWDCDQCLRRLGRPR